MYKRIKELREDNNLTQLQVGKVINVTQRTYSYYETGQRMMPPEVLIKLAKFYGTTVDYILGLTNEKKPYGQD